MDPTLINTCSRPWIARCYVDVAFVVNKMLKGPLLSLLLTVVVFCEAKRTINVDSDRGNDTLCVLDMSLDLPCQSLRVAVDIAQLRNNSKDLVLLLSNGVHLLLEELEIQGPMDLVSVSIQAISTHGAVIRCAEDSGGIVVERNVNFTLVGVVLEHCGPNSTAISVNAIDTLSLRQCIFRCV